MLSFEQAMQRFTSGNMQPLTLVDKIVLLTEFGEGLASWQRLEACYEGGTPVIYYCNGERVLHAVVMVMVNDENAATREVVISGEL